MARELAFVLINPYTIQKSRTGGVIARILGRTDLDFVAARMLGPSHELAQRYADLVRHSDPEHPETCGLIADYILRNYTPDPATGRPRRVMLLLFEGEEAIEKIYRTAGHATPQKFVTGETIRDTYGDYVAGDNGQVIYFEPAVLVGTTRERTAAALRLIAEYSAKDGGIVESGVDVPAGQDVQRTLVLIKPDNFRFPSARPGSIIDMLSSSGLRIVGVKKFFMSVAQAEQFYGPVRLVLASKFGKIGGKRVSEALKREFGFDVPQDIACDLCDRLGSLFAESQFENIVRFMTGYKPSECTVDEKNVRGRESCLALVYEGVDAIRKIRTVLGSTDPNEAKPGSIRREFGSDVMVNAAHASDSPENVERELKIIDVVEDNIAPIIDRYYK